MSWASWKLKSKIELCFRGIVERTVTLTDIRIEQQNKTFTFRADFCGELKIDQSIAHNGVCLDRGGYYGGYLLRNGNERDVLRSNLGQLQVGDIVNVERSMRPDALLDGHIVRAMWIRRPFVRPSMMPKAAGILRSNTNLRG